MSVTNAGARIIAVCDAWRHAESGIQEAGEFAGSSILESACLFADAGWRLVGFPGTTMYVVLCPACVAQGKLATVAVLALPAQPHPPQVPHD